MMSRGQPLVADFGIALAVGAARPKISELCNERLWVVRQI